MSENEWAWNGDYRGHKTDFFNKFYVSIQQDKDETRDKK